MVYPASVTTKRFEPPHRSKRDLAFSTMRAVAGSIPIVGAAAQELLGLLVQAPLEKRRDEWVEEVGVGLRQINVRLDTLSDSPVFIDAVASAVSSAMRTSDQQKRRALRNAVLNSVLPHAPSAMQQQVLLSLVDRLTPLHLAILGLFADPSKWRGPDDRALQRHGSTFNSTPRSVLEDAFPQLAGTNRALADVIWADLEANGLIRRTGIDNAGEGPSVMNKRLTDFGDTFVRFISDPF